MHRYYIIRIHIREKIPHSEMHVLYYVPCINLSIRTTTPLFIMSYILTQNMRYMTKRILKRLYFRKYISHTFTWNDCITKFELKLNRFSWSSWYPLVIFYHVLQNVVHNRYVTTKISGMSIKCYTHRITNNQIHFTWHKK